MSDLPGWPKNWPDSSARPLEEDAASIAEGFCPEHHEKLTPEGWCGKCQVYMSAPWRGGSPMVTRSNDPDYAKAFVRALEQ